jgi:FAD/FMN-containing dehydrogenase
MEQAQSTTAVLGDATMEELRVAVRGLVITAQDESYDTARKVRNGAIDKRPVVIVRCAGVADVIEAIQFARSQNLLVAVRGGGHNQAGFGVCDGGLVIDLSPMKGIWVDHTAQSARTQGGATWHDFDHETQAFGLASTGGLISTTGVAGLTLGGGMGWLMRKQGLACDNLLSADVVTAEGQVITASATENADLFWGLRGGGGNFGVVTSLEFRLHPLGAVLGGLVLYPAEKARDVLHFYRDYMAAAPNELMAFPAFITVPPLPELPTCLHGTLGLAIATCYAGDLEAGEKVVQPLRTFGPPTADLLGPMPYTALQSMFDASAPFGARDYWRSDYLGELKDEAIEILVEHSAAMRTLSPLTAIHLYPMGGVVSRISAGETAFNHRDARYAMITIGLWLNPEESEAHKRWVQGLWQAMRPFSSGSAYVNFLGDEGEERVRAAYGESYDRLVAIKSKYDPTNFFRVNQNIKPNPSSE